MHQFLLGLSLAALAVAIFLNYYDIRHRTKHVLNEVGEFDDLDLSNLDQSLEDLTQAE